MHKSDSLPLPSEQGISELDACGLACPLPLLKAKQRLRDLVSGEFLRVLATDQGSVRDFKAFADLSGHKLIEQSQAQGVYVHLLQKA
jgi:tRNA 2-thiouridine synthesizing protein A